MYPFLSPDWVEEVRKIGDEYRSHVNAQVAGLVADPIRVNLVVTDMPDGAGDLHAHSITAATGAELELGHIDDASITVTIDYATARDVVVEQELAAVVRAFLLGTLRVDGDIEALFGEIDTERDPMALMSALNVAGIQTLGDVDPVAAEIGERVRSITM
jgi:hypothetical protein